MCLLKSQNVTAAAKPGTKTKTSAKQEQDGDGFSELDEGDDMAGDGDAGGGGGGGGGLVGIIGSLSGVSEVSVQDCKIARDTFIFAGRGRIRCGCTDWRSDGSHIHVVRCKFSELHVALVFPTHFSQPSCSPAAWTSIR